MACNSNVLATRFNLNSLLLRWTRDTMSEIDVAGPSIVFGSCISVGLDDSLCRKRCRARPLPANSMLSNPLHVQFLREQSLARSISRYTCQSCHACARVLSMSLSQVNARHVWNGWQCARRMLSRCRSLVIVIALTSAFHTRA